MSTKKRSSGGDIRPPEHPCRRPSINNSANAGTLSEKIGCFFVFMMSVHVDAPIIIDGTRYTATLIKNNGVFYWCICNATVGEFEYDIILIPSRLPKEIIVIDGPSNITSMADMIAMNCIICEIKTRFMPAYTSQKQFRRNLQWSTMGLRFIYISINDTPVGIVFEAYKSLTRYYGQIASIWHCSYDEIHTTLALISDTI